MDLNNFLRFELPVYSKNYFSDKEDVKKYKGTAHYIIRKEDKKIVFRTFEFDTNQTIIESSNYVDGHQSDSYITAWNLNELKKYRLECFDWKTERTDSRKKLTEFKGDINYLNELIIKSKATPKDVVGFISGSNAGGELKKPKAAEMIVKFEKDCLVDYFGSNSLINPIDNTWILLGLLDNNTAIIRNSSFTDGVSWDDIHSIEKVCFCEVLNWDWKVVPWSKTTFEEDHVKLTEAIAASNRDLFIDEYEHSDVLMFDEDFFKGDIIQKIRHAVDTSNRKALTKLLRSKWTLNVNEDINEKHYSKDFVKGINRYKRCHIVEQHDAVTQLLNVDVNWESKKEYLEMVLNKNNYLLLENTLHDYWDNSGMIIINHYGDIINNGLPEEDFDQIVGENKNVYSKFENVMNEERKILLEYREHQDTI